MYKLVPTVTIKCFTVPLFVKKNIMILAVIYKINKNGNLSKGVNIIYTHHPYAMTWALFVGCKLKMSGSLETHLLVFQNNRGKRFCYTFTVYNIHLYCFSSEVWYSANVLGQY